MTDAATLSTQRTREGSGARFAGVVRSELAKLRTLPAVPLTLGITALASGTIAFAIAAQSGETSTPWAADHVVRQVILFAQSGAMLLGVLAMSHEYAGRQIHTSLISVPDRVRFIAAKTVALTLISLTAALLTVALAWSAVLTGGAEATTTAGVEVWGSLLGAVLYLVLMTLLAHAVTVLIRRFMPSLVTALALVLLVSPVLRSATEQARWLPDRAASQLLDASDTVLTPLTGAVVATAWILVLMALGVMSHVPRGRRHRDLLHDDAGG